ncbi:MAG: glycosyl transferase [Candidatus Magasanikbacteria bacterium CG11_big_fil_rev_8_21_14_0_20_39_34]|uniref:Glycosyl transferase n=1 Tax=Candidatus Magasanikbacteria bacterium CG11_big_fil_rev_8_21_14_0_20_39_34 TaxID=1974653 RepID=A0A2H0N3P3_9BACT|nr:MAG: glycosyl transferase [Candidatus Magasanikbacteria bacterium CG11_big_fil_rev_8_21_14_0_20_39_34]
MKIALVHDYLAQDGGAERVVKTFHEIWPEAPIFVLFHDKNKIDSFENLQIRESFLSKFPFVCDHYQWYLPLMPLATEHHDLRGYDVVLSSTSAFAKGVITDPGTIHICYCHTPTRYLWTDTHEYIRDLKYNKLVKIFLPKLVHKLRIWDRMSVDRVDHFVANSQTVQQRIQKYYRRDATVIYPPVNVEEYSVSSEIGDYFITGGRLAAYKRFDLVIQVFNRLGWPLKIFGSGPGWWNDVKKHAKSNIEFLGRVDEKEKAKLLSRARAFIHPQVEDFGITPVESMASGCPVIAFGEGGARETIIAGKTGLFFYEQTWEALFDLLLRKFDAAAFDRHAIREHALHFSTERFIEEMTGLLKEKYEHRN